MEDLIHRIRREDKRVWIGIHHGLATCDPIIWFNHECANQEEAELWRRHMNALFDEAVQALDKKAYNEGYCDGKQHKRKRDWFRSSI